MTVAPLAVVADLDRLAVDLETFSDNRADPEVRRKVFARYHFRWVLLQRGLSRGSAWLRRSFDVQFALVYDDGTIELLRIVFVSRGRRSVPATFGEPVMTP